MAITEEEFNSIKKYIFDYVELNQTVQVERECNYNQYIKSTKKRKISNSTNKQVDHDR